MMVTAGRVTARKKLVKTSTRLGLLGLLELLELLEFAGILTPYKQALRGPRKPLFWFLPLIYTHGVHSFGFLHEAKASHYGILDQGAQGVGDIFVSLTVMICQVAGGLDDVLLGGLDPLPAVTAW